MKCYIHPDREAMAFCTTCGKPICEGCHISVDSKATCVNCIKKELSQEAETAPEKNIALTMLLSFFPLVPVGFNYLYLGRPKKAMFFILTNIVMFVVFALPGPIVLENVYSFVIIILRIFTHAHCLAILNRTGNVYKIGLQYFVLICIAVASSLVFAFSVAFVPHELTTSSMLVASRSAHVTVLFSAILALGLFSASASILRRKKSAKVAQFEKVQNELPKPEQQKPEPDTDMASLHRLHNALKSHAYNFRDTPINNYVSELSESTTKIVQFVEKYPHKIRNINKFLDYYLPTTIKLLENYKHLIDQGRSGTNINKATEKIEDLLGILQKAYNNQLDVLFEDKALDIDAEVTVLKNILEKEGLLDSE